MEEPEKLHGKDLINIIKDLKASKTIVKMHIPEKDFTCLTIISDILRKKRINYFQIGYPDDFSETASNLETLKISIEFTGKDKLPHIFNTSVKKISGDLLWIEFPSVIERLQKRKDFRIPIPLGTKIYFLAMGIKHNLKALNLSRSGILCVNTGSHEKTQKEPKFKIGEVIEDIAIIFPPEKKGQKIQIKKAIVIWFEKDSRSNLHHYGLKFVETKNDQEETLIQMIYKIQREYLRKRLPIDT